MCLLKDALAPYQHIEQDLKSLKEVVEMKNQQIHRQEKKISDLEKVVGSNKLSQSPIFSSAATAATCTLVWVHRMVIMSGE